MRAAQSRQDCDSSGISINRGNRLRSVWYARETNATSTSWSGRWTTRTDVPDSSVPSRTMRKYAPGRSVAANRRGKAVLCRRKTKLVARNARLTLQENAANLPSFAYALAAHVDAVDGQ